MLPGRLPTTRNLQKRHRGAVATCTPGGPPSPPLLSPPTQHRVCVGFASNVMRGQNKARNTGSANGMELFIQDSEGSYAGACPTGRGNPFERVWSSSDSAPRTSQLCEDGSQMRNALGIFQPLRSDRLRRTNLRGTQGRRAAYGASSPHAVRSVGLISEVAHATPGKPRLTGCRHICPSIARYRPHAARRCNRLRR